MVFFPLTHQPLRRDVCGPLVVLNQMWRALVASIACFSAISIFALASQAADTPNKPRRILLLEGLTPTQPAGVQTFEAFKKRLAERGEKNVEVFIDFLELGRFPGPEHDSRSARFLGEQFAEKPPDLLVPISRGALAFVMRYRDVVAPGAVVIYCCTAASAASAMNLPRGTVGAVTEFNWSKTLDLAEQLQPHARNLVVISGASDYDRQWLADLRHEIEPQSQRYNTRYLSGLPYDELLQEVSLLPRDTIVLLTPVFMDGAGQPRIPPEVAADVTRASSAPAYAPIATLFDHGIVGGFMDSFEAQGVAVADLVLQVLSGTDPTTLPPQTKPAHNYQIDARQLARWQLSEANLPPGAVVRFSEPTLWEKHRVLLLTIISAFLLQSIVVAALLIQMHKRRRAEAEADLQRKEVSHLMRVSVLGELSGAIAHEVNQPLTAILAYAQAARKLLARHNPELSRVTGILNEIVQEDNRASEVIRRLHRLLRKGESKLEPIDLNDLIDSTLRLLHNEMISRRIKVDVASQDNLPRTSGDFVQLQQVMLNLFMNAMDAMSNTAPPKRLITVGTRSSGNGTVEAFVSDHGPGITEGDQSQLFQPFFTTKDHGLGLGLSLCSKIVKTHGGKLSVKNNASGGATASFTLPALAAAVSPS
jgi:signal transduction histidine kinase